MNYNEFCQTILKLDPSIRFVGVLGRNGTLIGGGHCKNSQPLLSENEAKMSYHYAALKWETRKNLSYKIGNEKYSITQYDKIKQISIPIDDRDLLLISTELDSEHESIINSTLRLLETQIAH